MKRLICVAWALLFLISCQVGSTHQTGQIQSKKLFQTTIQTTAGNTPLFVELATTPAEQHRGLMFRKNLPFDQGMLFSYEREVIPFFWMKNTPLSLDILFIDSSGKIVFIVQNTTPFSLENILPPAPCRYALEVNAGFVERHQIKAGDLVSLDQIVSK